MDKYEYTFMKFKIRMSPEWQSRDLHDELNKVGQEGWLMVGKLGCCDRPNLDIHSYETWGVTMARKIK